MNCIIPGLNLKVFARALQALAKVGDDLYIESSQEKLSLVALNGRKTVCVRCHLLDNFFSSYEVDNDQLSQQTQTLFCKMHLKTLLPLFKGQHLEKKLEFVKIEYEKLSDVIVFKMKYKCDDIIMVHKLRLMEAESLSIGIRTDLGSNNIVSSSAFYNNLLNTFSSSDDEITFEILKDKVVVRNYCVGAPVRPKSVRSHVNINGSEFIIFQTNEETTINFSLKPFRTAMQFAEAFNLNIDLNFEKGGRPLSIIMKNPTFEVNFIVATLNPYNDLQSTMTSSSIPAKITQLHKGNITQEDRDALENENWNDMDMETPKKKSSKKDIFMQTIKKAKQRDTTLKKIPENGKQVETPKSNKVCEVPMDYLEFNDVIARSPESPKTKRAKLVFGRCFESTFSRNNLGEVLAPNSDSE
ncbi:unnamed protein product [Phaedon cochleariae]|uniref:Cell cycle checkpoint control protein n=1 Tax=Phaedon cochleariae TaxID=80249 RepID=A0A9P0GPV5_PHACE|nr:unnamed protein product [Phaedon cochleariae]